MLQYIKKLKSKVMFYRVVIFAGFLLALVLIMGPDLFTNILGLVMIGAFLFLSNTVALRFADRQASVYTKKILDKYNRDCNPAAFIEEGRELADEILTQPPFKGMGAFYLSVYCSALIDQGLVDDATHYAKEIYNAAQASAVPDEKFGLFVNLYAPTRDLYGFDLAEECLIAVEEQINRDGKLSQTPGAFFIAWARKVFDATKEGDSETLVKLYEKKLMDEAQLPRERVDIAYKLAAVYRELEDSQNEEVLLRTVVEMGNTMGCVSSARDRLQELEDSPRQKSDYQEII